MTPDEFAELVGVSRDEVETYRSLGLLDPEDDGLLDDVDLVRLDFVHHRLAEGQYDPESLAVAIREGRVESMYGMRLFEAGSPLGLDDAAERAGLEPEQLLQVMAALGFSWSGLRESDMEIFDIIRVAGDAGLPWEAILGMTRVFGDSLRRIADSEIRMVHVYIHERLMAEGASEEEVERLISGIERNLGPLVNPMIQRLHREYLLEAMMEDAFFHRRVGHASEGARLGRRDDRVRRHRLVHRARGDKRRRHSGARPRPDRCHRPALARGARRQAREARW